MIYSFFQVIFMTLSKNNLTIYGSEFEKANLELEGFSFSLVPSAQYKAAPIKNSSLSDNLAISLLALSFISLVRAILISFIFCAPLRAEANFLSVNLWC